MIGSTAVNAYARPRSSSDIDFLVRISERELPRLSRELARRRLHLLDPRDLVDAHRDRSQVTVHPQDSRVGIDVKFARGPPEEKQVAEGRWLGNGLRVPRIEYVIAYQIKFGSDQDYLDVRNVLEMSGNEVDEQKLRSVMNALGVEYRKYQRLKERLRPRPPRRT